MPDKDIDKIPITVEVPKADVWLRNDYRAQGRITGDIAKRLIAALCGEKKDEA